MAAEARLKELGIELPGLQPAVGNYLPTKRHGDLVFVSGHGPLKLERLSEGDVSGQVSLEAALGALIQGKVGGDISLDEARAAARVTGLFMLSSLRVEIGSLDNVRSVLKVFGMAQLRARFQPDGSSDRRLLGPAGGRVRRRRGAPCALCGRYGRTLSRHPCRNRNGRRRKRWLSTAHEDPGCSSAPGATSSEPARLNAASDEPRARQLRQLALVQTRRLKPSSSCHRGSASMRLSTPSRR